MKKLYLLLLALSFLLISPNSIKANDLAEQLKGRILLQVEEYGEAWYINPDTNKRHFLGRPDDAFNLMRQLGLGISESDYNLFNNYAPRRLSGKILLRVEASGEAYYVNPVDLKMHFLGRPADAFNVMRTLGLGISNDNLAKISKVGDKIGSSIVSLNNTWNLYTNYNLGFKIKVPKTMYHNRSSCEWIDNSYRPKGGIVPVSVFENDNNVYISSQYFSYLSGANQINNVYTFSSCTRIFNSVENLNNSEYSALQNVWHFVARTVNNDFELENFIKEKYGSACRLGDKEPTNQAGVYNVRVLSDGNDSSTSECFMNFIYFIKYHPENNIAISWDIGQSYSFFADDKFNNSYDQVMLESFEFIK